ncbi:MAG: TlpA family protein disulfide reductase [Steroidobacteraceae bacterium]
MLLLAAALAGAAGGFLVFRDHSAATPVTAVVTPAELAAATDASAPPAPTIPATVPDISLPDLAGKPVALRSTDGHPRLFNFWATWCEPCRREIPLLNALQDAHAGDGLRIVGIAVDFRNAVQAYLKTSPLHYTSLVGEEAGLDAAQKFGMDLVLPFSVFADGQNRIVAVKVGELHREEADAILAQMRLLTAGKTTLGDAQAVIASTMKELATSRAKQSAAK